MEKGHSLHFAPRGSYSEDRYGARTLLAEEHHVFTAPTEVATYLNYRDQSRGVAQMVGPACGSTRSDNVEEF